MISRSCGARVRRRVFLGACGPNVERWTTGSFFVGSSPETSSFPINDEEFDYVYYCYGLDVFGNMPLIEPLEYTDDGCIRDFAIAIDTSASTKGETVFSFVERTYDILQESGLLPMSSISISIQCDAHPRCGSHSKLGLTSMRIWKTWSFKGLGGTDFRPVFSYVDELVESGELRPFEGASVFHRRSRGLSAIKPKYDVAFVLTDEAYVEEPNVPPWAMRVKFDSGEFRKASKRIRDEHPSGERGSGPCGRGVFGKRRQRIVSHSRRASTAAVSSGRAGGGGRRPSWSRLPRRWGWAW